jgi:excisionase family DNA binding protein
MSEKHFTIKQAAELLSCSYSFLWRQIRAGNLPTVLLGDGHRISESDLQAFLAARRQTRSNSRAA